MKAGAVPRWAVWLAIGLSAVGGLVAFAGIGSGSDTDGKPESAAVVRKAVPAGHRESKTVADSTRVELERLSAAQAPAAETVANAFDATSWYVPPPPPPPPPPAPPAPPPVPTAPPLPFALLGSYADSAVPIVIMSKGDRVYTVSPGEVIDGIYRVERLVGSSVELTYLPLNIRQTLSGA